MGILIRLISSSTHPTYCVPWAKNGGGWGVWGLIKISMQGKRTRVKPHPTQSSNPGSIARSVRDEEWQTPEGDAPIEPCDSSDGNSISADGTPIDRISSTLGNAEAMPNSIFFGLCIVTLEAAGSLTAGAAR